MSATKEHAQRAEDFPIPVRGLQHDGVEVDQSRRRGTHRGDRRVHGRV